jgi:hypothetical protein
VTISAGLPGWLTIALAVISATGVVTSSAVFCIANK